MVDQLLLNQSLEQEITDRTNNSGDTQYSLDLNVSARIKRYQDQPIDLEDSPFYEIVRLINEAFFEMGSQEPIMDFKTQGELKHIIDGYGTMDSYTKITERWGHPEHRHDFVSDLVIVLGEVHQPFSHRRDHIIGELLGTVICACITAVVKFSLVCYSTSDEELLLSSKVPRLFEDASFLKTVAWVMGNTTYPFLPIELDSLHKGQRDHHGSCLPYGSPIVMLIEDWHGHPRKDMDILMGEEASRRNLEQERQKDRPTEPNSQLTSQRLPHRIHQLP
jgi:hypothetical protein